MHILCPHCRNPIEVVKLPRHEEVACPSCGSSFRLEAESTTAWGRSAGQKLGKFELLAVVGQGAFGTVYKARDPELDRTVAIKVPRAGNLAGTQELDRFLREARSVAQLRHRSIVSVHEVGQTDGVPFLVSDFVQGITLADLLSGRQPPADDAARIVAEVAQALQYAHENGVIHRDVKPSNIMLDDQGQPHVMDFGLAKREAGEITMTVEGQVLGTPAYMSPEQARGEGHGVDGRGDVYSLGVILYQMLTGELPFRGTQRMLLHQVLHDEPRPPRRLNDRIARDLETICLKALAKEPARRYQTAGELAADLRRFLNREPIQARPVGRRERLWRWCRRNPSLASLTAVLFLLAMGLAAAGVGFAAYYAAVNRDLAQANDDTKKKNADVIAALNDKKIALSKQDAALKLAAQNADVAQERLGRSIIEKGLGLVATDPTGAALMFAEALRWDHDNPARNDLYRLRVHSYLQHQVPRLVHVWRHDQPVENISFSPDGRLVLVRTQALRSGKYFADGQVRVWDRVTGKARTPVLTHPEGVTVPRYYTSGEQVPTGINFARFTKDGQRILTGAPDGSGRVWNALTGEPITPLLGSGRHLTATHFYGMTPDTTDRVLVQLIVEEPRRPSTAVRLWDAQTGKPLTPPLGNDESVRDAYLFFNQHRLLTVTFKSDTFRMHIWDLTTNREILPALPALEVPSENLNSLNVVAFHDGDRFFTFLRNNGKDQYEARAYETRTGQPIGPVLSGPGESSSLNLNRSETQACILSSKEIRIWDVKTGKLLRDPFVLDQGRATGYMGLGYDGGTEWTIHPTNNYSKQVRHLWQNRETFEITELPLDSKLYQLYGPSGSLRHRSLLVEKNGQMQLFDTAAAKLIGNKVKGPGNLGFSSSESIHVLTGGRLVLRFGNNFQIWKTAPLLEPESPPVRLASPIRSILRSTADGRSLFTVDDRDQLQQWVVAPGDSPKPGSIRVKAAYARNTWNYSRWLQFAPNGKSLATVDDTGDLRLWNIDSVTSVLLLSLCKATQLTFTHDSSALIVGLEDGSVLCWDLIGPGPALPAAGARAGAPLASWASSDGRKGRLLIEPESGVWQVLDAATGKILSRLRKPFSNVNHVEFSPDGQRLLAIRGTGNPYAPRTTFGSALQVLDVSSGQALPAPIEAASKTRLALVAEYGALVTVDSDHNVWREQYRGSPPILSCANVPSGVRELVASDHLNYLLITANDDSFWLNTGYQRTQRIPLAQGERGRGFAVLHEDYEYVLAIQGEKTVRALDAATGSPIGPPLVHKHRIRAAHAAGALAVTLDEDGIVHLWEVRTGKQVTLPQPLGKVRQLFPLQSGLFLAIGMDGQGRYLSTNGKPPFEGVIPFANPVTAAVFSKSSAKLSRLATLHEDGSARLWNAATGQPVAAPLKQDGGITVLATDTQSLLTGGKDGVAKLWNLTNGEPLGKPMRHGGPLLGAVFDLNRFITWTATEVRTWKRSDGSHIGQAMKPEGTIHQVFGQKQGVVIASGKQVQLWDPLNGKPVQPPTTFEREVVRICQLTKLSGAEDRLVVTDGGVVEKWTLPSAEKGNPPHKDSPGRVVDFGRISSSGYRQALLTTRGSEARLLVRMHNQDTAPFVDGVVMRHDSPVVRAFFAATSYPYGTANTLNLVVTLCQDGSAHVWCAGLDYPLGSPLRHEEAIRDVQMAALPDQVKRAPKALVITVGGKQVRLWDAETAEPWLSPLQHPEEVRQAHLVSADRLTNRPSVLAQFLVTVAGKEVRVWDLSTGKTVGPPLRHDADVLDAFALDRRVVTVSKDGVARLWDPNTDTQIGTPLKHADPVLCAAIDQPSRRVLTISAGEARLWDIQTGTLVGKPETFGPVPEPRFRNDNSKLIQLTGSDGTLRIWRLGESGRLVSAEPTLLQAGITAQFSPDSGQLVTESSYHSLQLWDARTGRPLSKPWSAAESGSGAQFSPDGRYYLRFQGATPIVTDLASGRVLPLASNPISQDQQFSSCRLVCGLLAGQPIDALQGAMFAGLTGEVSERLKNLTAERKVHRAMFSADGNLLVTAIGTMYGNVDQFLLTNLARGTVTALPITLEGRVPLTAVAFSPEGGRLAVLSHLDPTCTLRLYDVDKGVLTAGPLVVAERKSAYSSTPIDVAFSRDGRFLLTTAFGITRTWKPTTGTPLTPRLKSTCAAFSTDGRLLLTASETTARVWDSATGQPLTPPLSLPELIVRVALSPDGHRALLFGTQNLAVWNLSPGDRSVEDLQLMAQVQAGRSVDAAGNFVSMSAQQLQEALVTLASRKSQSSFLSEDDLLAWNRQQEAVAEMTRDWRQAILHLDRLVAAEPQSVLWLLRRMNAELQLEQPIPASADWDRASALDRAESLRWSDREAATLEATKNWEGALFHLDRLLAASPEENRWLLRRAKVYANLNRFEKAVTDADRALASADRVDTLAWLRQLAEQAESTRQWHFAQLALDRLIVAEPKEGALYLRRGKIFKALAQDKRAEADFDQAVRLAPQAATAYFETQVGAMESTGKWPQAIAYLDRMIAANPKRGLFYDRRAWDYFQAEKWKEAAADYDRAIALKADVEMGPGGWRLWYFRGYSLAQLGDWDKAGADYDRAATGKGAMSQTWNSRALICLQRGDEQGYRRACADGLQRFGNTVSPLDANNIAWACAVGPNAVADFTLPIELARLAVSKASPNDKYGPLNTLGTVLYRAGQDDKAIEQITAGMKAHGKGGGPVDWLVLALAHHRLGHAEEAAKWLNRATAEIDKLDKDEKRRWNDRLETRLLLHEASQKLGIIAKPAPSPRREP